MLKEYIDKLSDDNQSELTKLERQMQDLIDELTYAQEWHESLQKESSAQTNIFSPRSIDDNIEENIENSRNRISKLNQQIEYTRELIETHLKKKNEYIVLKKEISSFTLQAEEKAGREKTLDVSERDNYLKGEFGKKRDENTGKFSINIMGELDEFSGQEDENTEDALEKGEKGPISILEKLNGFGGQKNENTGDVQENNPVSVLGKLNGSDCESKENKGDAPENNSVSVLKKLNGSGSQSKENKGDAPENNSVSVLEKLDGSGSQSKENKGNTPERDFVSLLEKLNGSNEQKEDNTEDASERSSISVLEELDGFNEQKNKGIRDKNEKISLGQTNGSENSDSTDSEKRKDNFSIYESEKGNHQIQRSNETRVNVPHINIVLENDVDSNSDYTENKTVSLNDKTDSVISKATESMEHRVNPDMDTKNSETGETIEKREKNDLKGSLEKNVEASISGNIENTKNTEKKNSETETDCSIDDETMEKVKELLNDIFRKSEICLALLNSNKNRCKIELQNIKKMIRAFAADIDKNKK